MKETIQNKLKEIEKKENVKIIMAIESGSRAWGFESPDSDYDVRFIYKREKEDYLKLQPIRDVIEWQLDETLDINGWDIKKALQLLYKSNPTIFEWCSSPIVYKSTDDFTNFKTLLPNYFSEKRGILHYLNMAEANYKNYLKTDEVKIKKYFYVLRPILAARWIMDRKCIPPILFSELYETMLCEELKPIVQKLLDLKMQLPEMGTAPRIDILNEYIDNSLLEIKSYTETIVEDNKNIEVLDNFFIELIL